MAHFAIYLLLALTLGPLPHMWAILSLQPRWLRRHYSPPSTMGWSQVTLDGSGRPTPLAVCQYRAARELAHTRVARLITFPDMLKRTSSVDVGL
jgi:hypothetical protein